MTLHVANHYYQWRSACRMVVRAIVAGCVLAASGLAIAANVGQIELNRTTDLRADSAAAARQGGPLVLMFSLPGCTYCAVIRRNYLAPLAADRLVVRELTFNSALPVGGFDGERITAAALALRYGVRVAPTVLLVGRDGALLAPPLVGGDVAGMYGAYLDQALAQARGAIAASRTQGAAGAQP